MSSTVAEKPKFTQETIMQILSNPSGKTFDRANTYLIWRMLQAMTGRQTCDEIQATETRVTNGIGFNKFDAPFLTDVAQRSIPYQNLSPRQAKIVAKKLQKYIGQLCEIAGTEYKAEKKVKHATGAGLAPKQWPKDQPPLDYDTYLCQKCGQVKNGGTHPAQWRPDVTGHQGAGNVCPSCLEAWEKGNPTDAPKIVKRAPGKWPQDFDVCAHAIEHREGFVCTGCGAVFNKPEKKK